MKRRWLVISLLAGMTFAGPGRGVAADHRIDFVARRAQMMALMDTGTALVLCSPDVRVRNADVNFRYRQESNLLYLSGLNRSRVALLLVPSGLPVHGVPVKVLLFAQESTDGEEPLPPVPDGTILPTGEFADILNTVLGSTRTVFVNQTGPGFMYDWLTGKRMFLERDSRKEAEEKHPQLKIKNAGPLISALRQIKTPAELDLIRRSLTATGKGIRRAMQMCRPGVVEYQLQAEIEHAMAQDGAWGPGFPSIIGSGPNALVLHYDVNRRTTLAGELVVMDVGAEMEGYAADVTRTIPVSGKFTAAQRKIYETVLRAQRAVIAAIRPGVPWKILDATARSVINEAGYDRFWRHPVSHHLGLDVHDVGKMDTLRAGMVITVEPGLYVGVDDTTVSRECRGIGVRIEDDVLVTGGGAEVLSTDVPKEVVDIERIMKRRR